MVYTDEDLRVAAKAAGANFTEIFNDGLKAFLQIGDKKAELLRELTKLDTKRVLIKRQLEAMDSREEKVEQKKLEQLARLAGHHDYYQRRTQDPKPWSNRQQWLEDASAALRIPVPELVKLLEQK